MKKLPTEIYLVERIPPDTEKAPWYGRTLTRLYRDRKGVVAFTRTAGWRNSEFKIWKAHVEWEEVGTE